MSATLAVTRSFRCPSISRRSHRLPARRWAAAPISRTTATATMLLRTPTLPDGTGYQANYEGGNVDLRVPYIGYAAESISYVAAGVDAYNALQAHVEKRMSHGIQVGVSYTWSHALDEQSGLGLFYNGNNPLNLRSGYGSSDLRPHPRHQLQLRLPDPRTCQQALPDGKTRRWMVAGWLDRAAERPAVQRHRLLRRHRQHLLLDRRRHHQPHRAAGQWMHGKDAR